MPIFQPISFGHRRGSCNWRFDIKSLQFLEVLDLDDWNLEAVRAKNREVKICLQGKTLKPKGQYMCTDILVQYLHVSE